MHRYFDLTKCYIRRFFQLNGIDNNMVNRKKYHIILHIRMNVLTQSLFSFRLILIYHHVLLIFGNVHKMTTVLESVLTIEWSKFRTT